MSYADWGRHHGSRHYPRYHDYPAFGLHITFLPSHYRRTSVHGTWYYYCDGLYYVRAGGDYVLVAPPLGAVVKTIPVVYQPVVVNGVTYYTDGGVYYVYTKGGYQVVAPPVTVVQPAPVVVTTPTASARIAAGSAADSAAGESYTINIPNAQGGYTAVVMKRSGTGFVGPQGEFYPEFPTVAQLKVMYAK